MQKSVESQLSALLDPHSAAPIRRLALVGVAKNCGKTTVLNYLLRAGICDGRTVGLMSVGIDGEEADALLGSPKPPILVRAGDWVITARDALAQSSARIEYVAALGFSTPLGEVICGRVIQSGKIILAGMRHRADLLQGCALLEAQGVDLVLVDGAYGRTVAAGGGVSDALIICTGAVVSPDMDIICRRTQALIDHLAPAPIVLSWQQVLLAQAIDADRFLLGGAQVEPTHPPARSALLGLGQAAPLWHADIDAIAIPGLVSDRVVEHLLAVPAHQRLHPRALLVPDGTVLQAHPDLLERLGRTWEIRALSSPRLLAVALNPHGQPARPLAPSALTDACRERWPNTIVFNPRQRKSLRR